MTVIGYWLGVRVYCFWAWRCREIVFFLFRWQWRYLLHTTSHHKLMFRTYEVLVWYNYDNCLSLLCYPDARGLYITGWTRSSYFALRTAPQYDIYELIYTIHALMLPRVWALRATWMSYMIPRDWPIHTWVTRGELYELIIRQDHLNIHACLPGVSYIL